MNEVNDMLIKISNQITRNFSKEFPILYEIESKSKVIKHDCHIYLPSGITENCRVRIK